MPIMEISIVPIGTKKTSLSEHVARAHMRLKRIKGIKYELTAMGTIIEANSTDKLLKVAKILHKSVFQKGIKRVVSSIKLDERLDKKSSITGKVEAVRRRL